MNTKKAPEKATLNDLRETPKKTSLATLRITCYGGTRSENAKDHRGQGKEAPGDFYLSTQCDSFVETLITGPHHDTENGLGERRSQLSMSRNLERERGWAMSEVTWC